jgi:hypothetical protein
MPRKRLGARGGKGSVVRKRKARRKQKNPLSGNLWVQSQHTFRIPGVNVTYSTGSGSAGLSAVVSIGTNLIQSFDSSWAEVFDEYRLLRCEFWFTMLQAAYNAPGTMYAYIDEDDNSSPTQSSCTSHGADQFSLSAEASQRSHERKGRQHSGPTVVYRPASYLDEDWYNASTSPVSFAFLKLFVASPPGPGNSALFNVTAWISLAFRGFQTPGVGVERINIRPHQVRTVYGSQRIVLCGYVARPSRPTDFLQSGPVAYPGATGGIVIAK